MMMLLMVMLLAMMMIVNEAPTSKCLVVRVHVQLSLPYSFKSPLNSPKYIFINTVSAPVWILRQIICNRLVARITLQP